MIKDTGELCKGKEKLDLGQRVIQAYGVRCLRDHQEISSIRGKTNITYYLASLREVSEYE